MKKKIGIFLNTPTGSFLKVFLGSMVGYYLSTFLMEDTDPFTFDRKSIKAIIAGGIAPILPIITNFINRQDTRYGKSPKPTNLSPDPLNPDKYKS